MKFMVMHKPRSQSVWKEKKFEIEKEAFSFAQSLKASGAAVVEIYQRGRVGYRRIG